MSKRRSRYVILKLLPVGLMLAILAFFLKVEISNASVFLEASPFSQTAEKRGREFADFCQSLQQKYHYESATPSELPAPDPLQPEKSERYILKLDGLVNSEKLVITSTDDTIVFNFYNQYTSVAFLSLRRNLSEQRHQEILDSLKISHTKTGN